MTTASFIRVDQPTQHPGVVRAERAVETLTHAVRSLGGARGTASLLLAAIVAALLVVANQVIDAWSEGHLLAVWIILWTIAFSAMVLLAAPLRRVGAGLRSGVKRWSADRRQDAQDDLLWQMAMTDARMMADISRAMSAGANRDVRASYY